MDSPWETRGYKSRCLLDTIAYFPQVPKSLNLLSEETTTAQYIISQGIRFRTKHSFIIHSQPSTFLQTHIIKPQLIIKYLTKTLQYIDCSYQGRQSYTDWFLYVWSSVYIKQHGCFEISNHKAKFGWLVALKRKWFPYPMNIFCIIKKKNPDQR